MSKETSQIYVNKDSRYARVMAVARRARQLMRESHDKGVNPWEVSLVKVGVHKPIKLALEEIIQGAVGFKLKEKFKENIPAESAVTEKTLTETLVEDSPAMGQEKNADDEK